MPLSPQEVSSLERSPEETRQEQVRELYQRLFPMLLEDFAHKLDIDVALQEVIARLDLGLSTHSHPVATTGTAAAQVGTTEGTVWAGSAPVSVKTALGEGLVKDDETGLVGFERVRVRVDFRTGQTRKPFSLVD